MPDALTVRLNGADEQSLQSGSIIRKTLSNNRASATLSWLYDVPNGFEIASDQLGTGTLGLRPWIHDTVEVLDSASNPVFLGIITGVTERYPTSGQCRCSVRAQDYTYYLANRIWRTFTLTAQSDRSWINQYIIESGLSGYIGYDTGKIAELESSVDLSGSFGNHFAKYMTGSELLKRLSAISGARWYVDNSGDLVYEDGTVFSQAAYDVSDTPNLSTTFPFRDLEVNWLFDRPSSIVDILGESPKGTTRSDSNGINRYGAWGPLYRDYAITDQDILNAIGEEIAAGDDPRHNGGVPALSGSFNTDRDGLQVGTLIEITSADAGLSGQEVLIYALTITNRSPSENVYNVTFGPELPALESEIALISDKAGAGIGFTV